MLSHKRINYPFKCFLLYLNHYENEACISNLFSKSWNIKHLLIIMINILCVMLKIMMALFSQLHMRVGILLTCEKHLFDPILSLWMEVCNNKTTSAFIEVSVSRQENEGYVYVLGESIVPVSLGLRLDFATVLTLSQCGIFCFTFSNNF